MLVGGMRLTVPHCGGIQCTAVLEPALSGDGLSRHWDGQQYQKLMLLTTKRQQDRRPYCTVPISLSLQEGEPGDTGQVQDAEEFRVVLLEPGLSADGERRPQGLPTLTGG